MKKALAGLLLLAVAAPAPLWAAATIKELDLAEAYDDENTIAAPVFDTASILPLQLGDIAAGYKLKKDKIVRRDGGGFFSKGPEYKLDKKIDLAAILTEALRNEAPKLGFRVAAEGEEAWKVQGTLKDIFVGSKQVYMGATLFYGYLDVELQVQKAMEEPQTVRLRSYNFYGAFNAGMGRKDEAKGGLGRLLLEGAQEILARLNRSYFKAPPTADIEARIAALGSVNRSDIWQIGLSGSPSAVKPILALLDGEEDEGDRSALIDALGRIGSAEAVAALAARYASEDEDCRWFTLKAMDYIGGDEATAFVKEKGTKDDDDACKRLAERVLDD